MEGMPELPEVETVVRGLRARIQGLVIARVRVRSRHLLRETAKKSLEALRGRAVLGVRRRGKLILIDCEGGWTVVVHLKMTGQFLFPRTSGRPDKHVHAVFEFRSEPRRLLFRDVRKFGFMSLKQTEGLEGDALLRTLGPEPIEISTAGLEAALAGRSARLKGLLLDQSALAGIGNIYADEILFESRLHPLRRASELGPAELRELGRAMRGVLRRAVRQGGSTIRDFSDCEGVAGEFQLEFKAYGRTGEPCRRCGRPIERIRLGQRSTHFCPLCQK
jgi:formamidopyrimidine-DNA glycosylase